MKLSDNFTGYPLNCQIIQETAKLSDYSFPCIKIHRGKIAFLGKKGIDIFRFIPYNRYCKELERAKEKMEEEK